LRDNDRMEAVTHPDSRTLLWRRHVEHEGWRARSPSHELVEFWLHEIPGAPDWSLTRSDNKTAAVVAEFYAAMDVAQAWELALP
jgi:hypothetical protein